MPDQEELMSVQQAAKFLDVDVMSIWSWRKQGKLPSYRLGGRLVRFKKSDLFGLFKKEPVPKPRIPKTEEK